MAADISDEVRALPSSKAFLLLRLTDIDQLNQSPHPPIISPLPRFSLRPAVPPPTPGFLSATPAAAAAAAA
eukprot:3479427-Pleurochrysis_carterae.AAC.1